MFDQPSSFGGVIGESGSFSDFKINCPVCGRMVPMINAYRAPMADGREHVLPANTESQKAAILEMIAFLDGLEDGASVTEIADAIEAKDPRFARLAAYLRKNHLALAGLALPILLWLLTNYVADDEPPPPPPPAVISQESIDRLVEELNALRLDDEPTPTPTDEAPTSDD